FLEAISFLVFHLENRPVIQAAQEFLGPTRQGLGNEITGDLLIDGKVELALRPVIEVFGSDIGWLPHARATNVFDPLLGGYWGEIQAVPRAGGQGKEQKRPKEP